MWLIPNAIIMIMNGIVITYWELSIAQDSFSRSSLHKQDPEHWCFRLDTASNDDTCYWRVCVKHKLPVVFSVSFFIRCNVVFPLIKHTSIFREKGDLRIVGQNPG